jgi:hypothetical protein
MADPKSTKPTPKPSTAPSKVPPPSSDKRKKKPTDKDPDELHKQDTSEGDLGGEWVPK